MFIFLTVTLFFQFKYRLFTSREMRVILNERALEPAFLAAGQCTCALVFQPCRQNQQNDLVSGYHLVVTSCMEELSRHFLSHRFRGNPDMFCSNNYCGSSVEQNGNFCRNCGKGKLFKLKLVIFAPLLDITGFLNSHVHGNCCEPP